MLTLPAMGCRQGEHRGPVERQPAPGPHGRDQGDARGPEIASEYSPDGYSPRRHLNPGTAGYGDRKGHYGRLEPRAASEHAGRVPARVPPTPGGARISPKANAHQATKRDSVPTGTLKVLN